MKSEFPPNGLTWALIDKRCLRHKFAMFLSNDGNFKLQRKRKVDDPDDIALNGGNAYFPEDSKYKDYLSQLGPSDDVRVLW
jgi:hypothetical protein